MAHDKERPPKVAPPARAPVPEDPVQRRRRELTTYLIKVLSRRA